jgi:hypothetical protein
LRLWIKARARLPLLLHQLAKTGQDKFAVLLDLFVGERAERIQEYSSGSFVGLVASASTLCSSVLVIYSRGLWQRQRMISRQSQLKNAYFRTLNIEAFR